MRFFHSFCMYLFIKVIIGKREQIFLLAEGRIAVQAGSCGTFQVASHGRLGLPISNTCKIVLAPAKTREIVDDD